MAAWMAEREPELWEGSEFVSVGRASISGKDLMAAWGREDAFANAVVEKAAGCLASAVGATINLLAPEAFVVGGGVATGNPAFVDLVREKTEPLVAPCFRGRYRIAMSELGEQVVTQGAAILAAQA